MTDCTVLVAGSAQGEVIVLEEPLSFWGGFDVATGIVSDAHHPQFGSSLRDRIVVMPFSRGSSSSANSLAEAIHRGTGPAAILLDSPDEIVVLGAAVPGELYDEWRPVVVVGATLRSRLRTGQVVAVSDEGVQIHDDA